MDRLLNTWNLHENPQDLFIYEENFSLSPSEREFAQTQMEKIQNLAPAFSALHLNLKKMGHFYHIELDIYSVSQKFHAKTRHRTLKFAIKNIQKEMLSQLRKWKQKRFQKISPTLE